MADPRSPAVVYAGPADALSGPEPDRPSVARVYDYLLGGQHNFAADRRAAMALREAVPGAAGNALASRLFLIRAVRFLLDRGIRQFLDLGSGLPTVGNVHEVAQSIDRDARVVYVDVDPVAVELSRQVLTGNRRADVIRADLRDTESVLDSPEVWRLIDLRQPVGLLAVSVLHFLSDSDDPASVLNTYGAALAAGSYVAISHVSPEHTPPPQAAEASAIYAGTGTPVTPRSQNEIARLFTGLRLVPPGLVPVATWRPDPTDPPGGIAPGGQDMYGGVGQVVAAEGDTDRSELPHSLKSGEGDP